MAHTQVSSEKHVILCGLGQVGWLVLDLLRQTGWPTVVVDERADPADPRLADLRVVRGDCRLRATLEAAGLANAKALLVLTSNDLVNLTTTLTARSVRPDLRVVARFFNPNIVTRLGAAVPNVVAVSKSGLAAPLFALTALSGETLGAFDLPSGRREIAELRIGAASSLRGTRLGKLTQLHHIAILEHQSGKPESLPTAEQSMAPRSEAVLEAGDRLAVCGPPAEVARLSVLAQEEGDIGLRWANFFWRQGRVVYRALVEIDWPVKAVVIIFFAVLALGSLVFHYAFNWGWAEGVYRTVSVMSTYADMKADRDHEELKIFIVFLRIAGIVLTASLTALLTNYLVRARLGGALAASRIPDSGHVVLCGLGNVGIRIVEELRRMGAPVVILEKASANPFILAARQLRATVIVSDGTLKETLERVYAHRARAVVAATSNDLVNVEIALLARDLNPKQRVVLRLDDPLLASALRNSAPIRHALAVPALAAPVVVAALFQERVLCLFNHHQRVMAVVQLVVDAEVTPHLLGRTVRAAAIDHGFTPIELVSSSQASAGVDLGSRRLECGDQLTVILPLKELKAFLRHEPPPREWAIDVTSYPLPMRDWLAQLFRTLRGTDAATAHAALEQMPLRLAQDLSRGDAEDLLNQLQRERIPATLAKT